MQIDVFQISFILFNLLICSSPSSEFQRPGILIEKLMFSSVILKTELVASKLVKAGSHLPSSARFIGGLNKNFAFAYSF